MKATAGDERPSGNAGRRNAPADASNVVVAAAIDDLLDCLDDGLVVCDRTLVISAANEAAGRLLGLGQDALAPGSRFDVVLAALAGDASDGRLADAIEHVISGGTATVDLPGQAGPVALTIKTLAAGGLLLCLRPATDDDRLAAALRLVEQRYETSTHASGHWVWETDHALRFTYLSPTIEATTGFPPEWYYGKTRGDLVDPRGEPKLWKAHSEALRRRQPFSDLVYAHQLPDGATRWLKVAGTPLFADDGTFLGYRGIGTDVTGQRKADQTLRDAVERAESTASVARSLTQQKDSLVDTLTGALSELEKTYSRLEVELGEARRMQEAILPKPSSIAAVEARYGLKIDSHFAPSSMLGGDYWSLWPIDDARLAFCLTDFSGHGVNAALNTFRLHTLLNQFGPEPAQCAPYLKRLNGALKSLLPIGQFATMLCGIIDIDRNTLEYASAAGTRPIVYLPENGRLIAGENAGLPLGIAPSPSYDTWRVKFPPGASLLLYSDALIETPCHDGEMLGDEGLAALLSPLLAGVSHATLTTAVVEAFAAQIPEAPGDDLTVVSFHRGAGYGTGSLLAVTDEVR